MCTWHPATSASVAYVLTCLQPQTLPLNCFFCCYVYILFISGEMAAFLGTYIYIFLLVNYDCPPWFIHFKQLKKSRNEGAYVQVNVPGTDSITETPATNVKRTMFILCSACVCALVGLCKKYFFPNFLKRCSMSKIFVQIHLT